MQVACGASRYVRPRAGSSRSPQTRNYPQGRGQGLALASGEGAEASTYLTSGLDTCILPFLSPCLCSCSLSHQKVFLPLPRLIPPLLPAFLIAPSFHLLVHAFIPQSHCIQHVLHAIHCPKCWAQEDEKGTVPLSQSGRDIITRMSSVLSAGKEGLVMCEGGTFCGGEATSFLNSFIY